MKNLGQIAQWIPYVTAKLKEIYGRSKFENEKDFVDWALRILDYANTVQLEVREDVVQ